MIRFKVVKASKLFPSLFFNPFMGTCFPASQSVTILAEIFFPARGPNLDSFQIVKLHFGSSR